MREASGGNFEVIIGCDLIYVGTEIIEDLIQTVQAMAAPEANPNLKP